MSELRIYINSAWRDGESDCPWVLLDEQGSILQSGNAPLAKMPKGHDGQAIVAPDRILNTIAALPPGGRRRWQKVLPFAVEEFSLADPEDNHVVPGAELADGRHLLYVMDKAWLRRIVGAAQQAGISLRRMVSEAFLPEYDKNTWVVVWEGNGGFVATGHNQGLSLDTGDAGSAPLGLRLALAHAPQLPATIRIRPVQDASGGQPEMPQWQDVQIPLVAAAAWDWRRVKIAEDAVNMLWGEFTPRAKIQEWWPSLRPAAWLLLAVFIVEAAGSNLAWVKLLAEKNQLKREMQKTFRATFGDEVTLVNAPLQMQRNLAELRHAVGVPDSGDFLPLLSQASPALSALPSGSVSGMHYEAGRLDFDIRLPRRDGFAVLKQALQEGGLSVRLGEARDLGNGVEAKVSVLPEGM